MSEGVGEDEESDKLECVGRERRDHKEVCSGGREKKKKSVNEKAGRHI